MSALEAVALGRETARLFRAGLPIHDHAQRIQNILAVNPALQSAFELGLREISTVRD